MGVKKYHSVDEMPDIKVYPPLDSTNFVRLSEVIALVEQLCPCRYEPGVRKFRSIEEAARFREQREAKQHARRKEGVTRRPNAKTTSEWSKK
jgi:hypothetical protein